jgi:hypothetical protein
MKLRHLETRVQHEFVLVDEKGEFVRKIIGDPITINAAQWPEYSATIFPAMVAADEIRLAEETPEPNRAQRRKKPPKGK